MSQKLYVPKSSAKEMRGDYEPFINVSFSAVELREFLNQHTNDKGYLNLTISPRKEVGRFGDTHSISLNTYVPKPRTEQQPRSSAPEEPPKDDRLSVPF